MTPERWKQVERVFHEAQRRKGEARTRFLDLVCRGDPELRREVESLLETAAEGTGFLGRPAMEVAAEAIAGQARGFHAGQHLGPYELVSPLGSGGMGEVWRARDPALRRDVAIKVLLPVFAGDKDRLRRFEREARAAGMLNHPNVLAVYAVGREAGRPYLVTELLEGESLRQYLRQGLLPFHTTVEYAIQVAKGLAALHDRGLVHRDLKPENVFLTSDGRVKILDFGLAKLAGPNATEDQSMRTATGMVLGTPGYMSPEQVRGDAIDHRSDLFAFGAILYEMLAGRAAFSGSSAVEVMSAALTEEPAALEGVPAKLRRVVERCLDKDRVRRIQSARDLAQLLEAEKPAPPAVREVGKARPRLSILAVIVASLVLAGVSYIAGKFSPRFEKQPVGEAAAVKPSEPPVMPRVLPLELPKETAPAPAPQARPVEFAVNTKPPGAGVRLDGQAVPGCSTPCVLRAAAGVHTVSMLSPGFRETVREVRVSAGMRPLALIELAAAGGVLMVQSQPAGAAIFVDGEKQAQTTPAQLSLKPGLYRIRLEKDRLKWEQSLEVKDGDFRHLAIPLEP